ncbi:hypothetical protein BDN72DRAFT_771006 [Pluteus cervinus]|uniref:Uncharacterized protein n=1 Tax=Pluteus cervinus TaxID=181527 RepID=A0ACD3ANQ0_9AGAR|nr:hypothetical protein BDN72DRAFT_771006 [Pluteus cervinus]
MSRLIVKNLPHYVTPARLKEHFDQKGGPGGTITDFKVAFKQDGTSRRFGFIGYKTEKEAVAAQEWFNKTFIDSTRIQVSVVDGAEDAPAPRPNKRPRLGPASNEQVLAHPPQPVSEQDANAKSKDDRQLDRFLEVMQPRNKNGPSWANDANTVVKPAVAPAESSETQPSNPEDEPTDSISDLDWMRRHTKKGVEEEEKAFEQSDDEMGGGAKTDANGIVPELSADPTKRGILETGRLFLRNLAFSCSDADLLELFKPYGDIAQVHIPVDSLTKQSKGLAYVTFKVAADAVSAYEALDKKSFQGRLLHILAAVDRKPRFAAEDGEGKKKTVKDEINAKRKATAGKEFNWSMLYMNSDAVASSVAGRMGVSKADLLGAESATNAAVKLALAETHVIQETKNYLESQGVLLSSFSSKARSNTTILVKNIPYGTGEDQIREMFVTHGDLSRVLVPPAGTMAVVEFDKPDEAAKAFRAIAYRRLGNSVVYLEKGPLGMFTDTPVPSPAPAPNVPTHHSAAPIKILEQEVGGDGGADEPSISGGSTLFVKNLAFSTTQERLAQVFRSIPGFLFARIQTKPDPKRPDARLSMGYGFVGFKDVESASKAMKSMQGFVLDGHSLHVKFAGRGAEESKEKDKEGGVVGSKSTTTKMIVKNVPFEATKKDIRDLFGAHGHLKSVRVPKKFDSRSRGFAFLEFVSRREAENAYAMLKHTHLLGRHLVLEWAEEGDGAGGTKEAIEKLRKKAGVGLGDGKEMPGKKRKLSMALGSDMQEGDEED